MKKVWVIIRWIIIVLLLFILSVNLYFIGARLLLDQPNPKLFGFSQAVVLSGSMEPEFSVGDMLIYKEETEYGVGDIVMFRSDGNYVTHRIVGETADGFITQGDANNTPDSGMLSQANIEGKMVWIFPGIGEVQFFLRSPLGILLFILLGLFFWEFPAIEAHIRRRRGK